MINIQDIILFMKKGWVAMDKDGEWYWFKAKPRKYSNNWTGVCLFSNLDAFDIAPADDWTKSLIRIKGKDNE